MAREPVAIPNACAFTCRASRSGADYRIAVAEPIGPAPADGYPVVYLLDADSTFGTMVEAVRARCRRPDATGVGPAVVVGVGYGADQGESRTRRTYDYTPGPSVTPPDPSIPGNGQQVGGADDFLQFLEHDLTPAIDQLARIDSRRRVLFGHSLAGFFALWALTRGEKIFSTVIAVSPSIWWNPPLLREPLAPVSRIRDEQFEQFEPAHSAPAHSARPRVMLTVGEFEQRRAPWQPADAWTDDTLRRRTERRMVDAAREMAETLEGAGAIVDFHEFAGEDHASVVILSIARALRFALPAADADARKSVVPARGSLKADQEIA
jgi:predicted alpha/beta superfamily hydrolase